MPPNRSRRLDHNTAGQVGDLPMIDFHSQGQTNGLPLIDGIDYEYE
jgi:hypothetical protein